MTKTKTRMEEIHYLGLMLTATMEEDVTRLESIMKRLNELTSQD